MRSSLYSLIMKISHILLICLMLFSGCKSYFIQNFIGNPTTDLDRYTNHSEIKTDKYEPTILFQKVRSYLYKNEADVYKKTETILYVRNLGKIFKHTLNTTTIKLDFSQKDGTIILTSKNLELVEYLKDTLIQKLQEQDVKNEEKNLPISNS